MAIGKTKKQNLRTDRKRMRKVRKNSDTKMDSMRDGRRGYGKGISR